ncbi:carboxypeptidase-like regulatory domain-containing protein [Hymenobacter gummosus]|nr:carboxypeptidase-like regulatory domain-containing protein [Hymenobacter gummosus]
MRLLALPALLLTLLTTAPARAQTAPRPVLSGRVVNSARQPLAGVSVLVQGSTLGTSTNSDGLFLLENLPAGPHTLRFDLSGFVITDVAVTDTTRQPLQVRLVSTRPPVRSRPRRN